MTTMVRLAGVLAVLLSLICLQVCAQDQVVLWDFEEGIEGWWGNPWSGGKAEVSAAEGKFGRGLRGSWEDIPQQGNVVSPFLPDDAPWRDRQWWIISFWLKGDGSQANATLSVMCRGEGDKELGYSRAVPLDGTGWRRFSLDMRTFWNRERRPFTGKGLRRLIFASSGTHEMCIDQIALEAAARPVPLERLERVGEVDLQPELEDLGGRYLLRLDPSQFVVPPTFTARVTWPDGARSEQSQYTAAPATGEVRLPLSSPSATPGEVTVELELSDGDLSLCRERYRFVAVYPQPPLEPVLGLLPTPKNVSLHPEEAPLVLPGAVVLRIWGPDESVRGVQEHLATRLEDRCGVQVELGPPVEGSVFELAVSASGREAPRIARELPSPDLGPEAYALRVTTDGARIVATARQGLRYGALTLLQLAVEAAGRPEGIPALSILDWPSLPIRGLSIPLPTDRWGHPNDAPVDPDFWEDFLLRTCLEHKLNTVVILVRQGMKYARHPEIDGPAAWEQDTVRRVVQTLKAHDINPIPLLDSLGHANWLVIPVKQLREDGDTQTLCTRHPDSAKFLLDCYDEVIDVFSPTHFHMGLDEIRWQTLGKPEAERCPLCAGLDKREVFVQQVGMLHEYLTQKGIVPMMWGDMVLTSHNGGPPFHLDDTLKQLPRDIVMTNWSVTLDQLSNRLFASLGFPVIQSNSLGVSPAQAPWVQGNFFGCWAKHPWITEGAPGVDAAYSYLSLLTAAEYSWNLYPQLEPPGVPLSDAFFAPRLQALTRPGLRRPPGTQTPLAGPGLSEKGCDAGRPVFTPWQEPLRPTPDAPVTLDLGRRADAIYLLLAAEVPAEEKEAFRKRFQEKDTWNGVPVARVTLHFADGSEATREISYGVDVRDAVGTKLPYVYNAIGYWTAPDGRTWYALQWPNPHPAQPVAAITLHSTGTEAQPLIVAAAVDESTSHEPRVEGRGSRRRVTTTADVASPPGPLPLLRDTAAETGGGGERRTAAAW